MDHDSTHALFDLPGQTVCRGCGEALDPLWSMTGLHPMCTDDEAEQIKEEICELIRWGSHTAPRSQQVSPGPSELGVRCPRRLAYRLSGAPVQHGRSDPLISVVGTAIHAWMASTIEKFNVTFGADFLSPENRLTIDGETQGVSDAYHTQLETVIDFKSAGAEVLKKQPDVGPEPVYRHQVHLYGLGYEKAGLPVRAVSLVYIPRSGQLSGVQVWREPYRRDVAVAVLARRDEIAAQAAGTDDFTQFPGIGSAKECFFCPYKGRDMLMGATRQFGCPGPDQAK